MKYEHLCRLVEYLYCGKTKIKASELDEFFLATKRYKILGLNESPIQAPSKSRTPHESSVSDVQCSMTIELPWGSSNDDNDDEHNRTDKPGQHGSKRKIDENQNESSLKLGKTSRKSIPNMSKPQRLSAEESPDNRSPSVQKTATPPTEVSAPNEVGKHATPSTSKSANGK